MKTFILTTVAIFILLFPSITLPQPMGMMKQWSKRAPCLSSKDLNLSQEQLKGIRMFQQEYFREIRLLRIEFLSKRMELRELLKDPQTNTDSLREKFNELLDLQSKLDTKTLEYLIKIRSLFTQEQLHKWCPELEIPFFREMMHQKMGLMHRGFPNE